MDNEREEGAEPTATGRTGAGPRNAPLPAPKPRSVRSPRGDNLDETTHGDTPSLSPYVNVSSDGMVEQPARTVSPPLSGKAQGEVEVGKEHLRVYSLSFYRGGPAHCLSENFSKSTD